MIKYNFYYSILSLKNTLILFINLTVNNSLVAVWFNGQSMLIPNMPGRFLIPMLFGGSYNDIMLGC